VKKLTLPQAAHRQIIGEALAAWPLEACGLLAGQGAARIVQLAQPVPNVSPTPQVAYQMEPRAMVAAIYRCLRSGLDVLAIYHSHPTGSADLSPRDLAEATWHNVAYLVVGLQDPTAPQVKAWWLAGGLPQPVALEVLAGR
jgi:proteasome lid subunit RPN8/RPN11